MQPRMDQMSPKKEDCETPGDKRITILEKLSSSDTLEVVYEKDFISNNKDKKETILSEEDATAYIRNSKNNFMIMYPECAADLCHVEKVMNITEKQVLIDLTTSAENELTGPLLDLTLKKCLEKEKNNITCMYDNYFYSKTEHKSHLLTIDSEANNFACQILQENNSLFPHMIESLKALKNTNQLITIRMGEDFKTLFESMQWKFDQAVVNWMKEKMKTDSFTVPPTKMDIDSNTYIIEHYHYHDMDNASVDDCTSFSEVTEELSSEEKDAEKTEPTTVSSCYFMDKKETFNDKADDSNDVVLNDYPLSNSIHLCYWKNVDEYETRKMSRDAALSHIKLSKNEEIFLHDPETPADRAHVMKILDIWKDKQACVTSSLLKSNGIVKPLLKLGMKKCLEKEKNTITFRYKTGKYIYTGPQVPDLLHIESQLNNFTLWIDSFRKDLFPSLVKCLKATRNQNYSIIIMMEHDIAKLFDAMGWMKNSTFEDFEAAGSTDVALQFSDERKEYDNNQYGIYKYDEDQEDSEAGCEETEDNNKPFPVNSCYVSEELEAALGTPTAAGKM